MFDGLKLRGTIRQRLGLVRYRTLYIPTQYAESPDFLPNKPGSAKGLITPLPLSLLLPLLLHIKFKRYPYSQEA